MKSLNVQSLVAALLIAACTFVSCKKDKDVASPKSIIEGTWEGMYGVGNDDPSMYFALIIHSNGTIQVKSGDKNNPAVQSGTWSLDGDVFKAVYENSDKDPRNIAAKLDEAQKKLLGSWGFGESNPAVGDFYVNKQ